MLLIAAFLLQPYITVFSINTKVRKYFDTGPLHHHADRHMQHSECFIAVMLTFPGQCSSQMLHVGVVKHLSCLLCGVRQHPLIVSLVSTHFENTPCTFPANRIMCVTVGRLPVTNMRPYDKS